MSLYRFLDDDGEVVAADEFADHRSALSWAMEEDAHGEDIQRVEYLAPDGDWRWAGPLKA